MSAQTSYLINQRVGLPGQLADLHYKDTISLSVEPAAGIGFGIAVTRGTDPEKQCDFAGSADFLGITLRSLEREGALNSGDIKYDEKETAGILRRGYIYVTVPAGCAVGDAAKYTDATGVIDSGAAGAGETQLDGAFFETAAAAGEVAKLRLANDSVTAGS